MPALPDSEKCLRKMDEVFLNSLVVYMPYIKLLLFFLCNIANGIQEVNTL